VKRGSLGSLGSKRYLTCLNYYILLKAFFSKTGSNGVVGQVVMYCPYLINVLILPLVLPLCYLILHKTYEISFNSYSRLALITTHTTSTTSLLVGTPIYKKLKFGEVSK